jgi:hypothetical protein
MKNIGDIVNWLEAYRTTSTGILWGEECVSITVIIVILMIRDVSGAYIFFKFYSSCQ